MKNELNEVGEAPRTLVEGRVCPWGLKVAMLSSVTVHAKYKAKCFTSICASTTALMVHAIKTCNGLRNLETDCPLGPGTPPACQVASTLEFLSLQEVIQ